MRETAENLRTGNPQREAGPPPCSRRKVVARGNGKG